MPFTKYTFHYSWFHLLNSSATFQQLTDDILGDLGFCTCNINDILIFPGTFKSAYRPSLIVFVTMDWLSNLTNVPTEYQKWNFLAATSLVECSPLTPVNTRQFLAAYNNQAATRIRQGWSSIIISSPTSPMSWYLCMQSWPGSPRHFLWETQQE